MENEQVQIPKVSYRPVLGIVSLIVGLTLLAYAAKWGVGFFETVEAWGQFGDFLGGILNPVIGIAGVILLSQTLNQNQTALRLTAFELQESRKQLKISAASLKSQEELMRQESYTLGLTTICTIYREELTKERTRFSNKSIADIAYELRKAIMTPDVVPDSTFKQFRYYTRTQMRFLIPISAKFKSIEDEKVRQQLLQLTVAYLSTDVISSVWFRSALGYDQRGIYKETRKLCEELLASCHMTKLSKQIKKQIVAYRKATSANQENQSVDTSLAIGRKKTRVKQSKHRYTL